MSDFVLEINGKSKYAKWHSCTLNTLEVRKNKQALLSGWQNLLVDLKRDCKEMRLKQNAYGLHFTFRVVFCTESMQHTVSSMCA